MSQLVTINGQPVDLTATPLPPAPLPQVPAPANFGAPLAPLPAGPRSKKGDPNAPLIPLTDKGRPRCTWIFSRGKNEGGQCDKTALYDGGVHCRAHATNKDQKVEGDPDDARSEGASVVPSIPGPAAAAPRPQPPAKATPPVDELGSSGPKPSAPRDQDEGPMIVIPGPRAAPANPLQAAELPEDATEEEKKAYAEELRKLQFVENDIRWWYERYPRLRELMPPEVRDPSIPPEEWLKDMQSKINSDADMPLIEKGWCFMAEAVEQLAGATPMKVWGFAEAVTDEKTIQQLQLAMDHLGLLRELPPHYKFFGHLSMVFVGMAMRHQALVQSLIQEARIDREAAEARLKAQLQSPLRFKRKDAPK